MNSDDITSRIEVVSKDLSEVYDNVQKVGGIMENHENYRKIILTKCLKEVTEKQVVDSYFQL